MTEKTDLSGKKIGFIGCGNMGGAILDSFLKDELVSHGNVIVSEKDVQKRLELRKRYPEIGSVWFDNEVAVEKTDIVILAVKPHQLEAVLKEIAPVMTEDKILISIAAGVRIGQIEEWLKAGKHGDYEKVFRVMPNMFMEAGQGMIEICRNAPFGKQHSKEDLDIVKQIFSAGGKVMVIDEDEIDAFSGLAGSSPAYMSKIAEAYIDAGMEQGIEKERGRIVTAQLLRGMADYLDAGGNLRDLVEKVCSPGGSTIQGLAMLEKSGLVGTIMEVIKIARYGAAGLGQEK
jgi:pyrroline-5-carboxylate reductase